MERLSNSDRFMFFGVWGALIGVGLFYGFHFMRGVSAPLVIRMAQALIEPGSTYEGASILFLNLFHTLVAAVGVVALASLIILLVLKERRLMYCIVPSAIFFGFSYKDYLSGFGDGWRGIDPSFYILQIVNPIVFVLFFIAVFWVSGKAIAPNTAPQPTQ